MIVPGEPSTLRDAFSAVNQKRYLKKKYLKIESFPENLFDFSIDGRLWC